jgi:hypothetical protein
MTDQSSCENEVDAVIRLGELSQLLFVPGMGRMAA